MPAWRARKGTMVVAAAQTAGRGRLGRSWYSPPGAGLYVSLVFRSAAAAPFLTLAGGVAVADGIRVTRPGCRSRSSGRTTSSRRRRPGRAASQDRRHPRRGLLVGGGSCITSCSGSASTFSRRPTRRNWRTGRRRSKPSWAAPSTCVPSWREVAGRARRRARVARGAAIGAAAGALARAGAVRASATAVECDSAARADRGVAAGIADDGALLVRVGGQDRTGDRR